MPAELVRYDGFNFHGDLIPLAKTGREPAAFFPALARLIGRDPQSEWQRLRRVEAYRSRMFETTDPATRVQLHWLSRGAILHWLSSIYTDELAPQYRAKHTAWVSGLIDAIDAYVATGVAVNEAVVGTDAKRQIEAIVEQARASRLAECRQWYEIARRDLPGDAIVMARTEQMLRAIISREAGRSAPRSAAGPETIAGILGAVGVQWSDPHTNQFGVVIANEYRDRYGKNPPTTNQFGRGSEPGTYSGRSTYPRCYLPEDWPWILHQAREWGAARGLPVPQ